jgi:predicted phosphodiesterase
MRQEKSRIYPRPSWVRGLLTTVRFLAVFILVFSLALLLASFIYGGRVLGQTAPPALLGNKPETIALLEKDKDIIHPFTFWVAGDTHKDNYLRTLYPEQIKPQRPAFGINLGDVVEDPLKQQHRYFWNTCRRMDIDSPMFVVVGNHDVGEGQMFDRTDYGVYGFDLTQFRDTYGPDEFTFTYAGCLFIVINNSIGGEAYMDFLEGALEREASGARMIFVICHLPFRTDYDVAKYPAVFIPRFRDLAVKYRIDYLISGHFHTYVRQSIFGTTHLISGGGTGLFGRESTSISHGILFNVDPAARVVTERVMITRDGPARKFLYQIDYLTVVILAPFIAAHPLLGGAGCAVVLLLLGFLIGTLVRRPRKKDAARTR